MKQVIEYFTSWLVPLWFTSSLWDKCFTFVGLRVQMLVAKKQKVIGSFLFLYRHMGANQLLVQDQVRVVQETAIFVSFRVQLDLKMQWKHPNQLHLRLLNLNLTLPEPILLTPMTGHLWMIKLWLLFHTLYLITTILHQGKMLMLIFPVFSMVPPLKSGYQHLLNFVLRSYRPDWKAHLLSEVEFAHSLAIPLKSLVSSAAEKTLPF